ncbi:MAG: DUF6320 domain-containing protein [Bacilli bacterium]|nr:DUF6320 domain-containing protein [Bacilli bacterium]
MKQCPKCNVNIHTNRKTCPLCYEKLVDLDKEKLEYTIYPEYRQPKKKTNFFVRSTVFLAITAIIITTLVNAVTYTKESSWWSFYVLVSMLYFLVLIKSSIVSRANPARKIVIQMVTISILVLAVDFIARSTGWSYTYVVPFLSVASSATIAIILLTKSIRYSDYIIYLLSSLFIGLIPFVLWIFKLVKILWPSLAAACFSLVILLAMLFFADREIRDEFKKRFHI